MSYVLGLVAAVSVLVGLRTLAAVPFRTLARPLSRSSALLLVVGVLGLVFHCGAMFFRSAAIRVPGSTTAVDQINAMGSASRIWFIVPLALVLLGLHRQFWPALAAVALTLAAAGITMYDNGPLNTHLTAIFFAVITLAATVSLLVPGPGQWHPGPALPSPPSSTGSTRIEG